MANVVDIIVRITRRGFQGGTQAVVAGLNKIKTAATLAATAVASIFTTQSIKNAIEYATTIDDISRKLETSTEFLSELQFATQQNNIQFKTFTDGLQRLARRLADAENGAGPAAKALEALGIEAASLQGLDLEQRFLLIAEALSRVEDESARVSIAFKLFDRGGVELLRVVDQGAAGIERFRERARDLNLSLSKESTEAAATLGGELTELNSIFRGIANTVSQVLVPLLNRAAEGYRTLFDAIRLGNKEAEELNLDQATERLAKVQADLARNSAKLLDVNRQLVDSGDLRAEQIENLRDQYKALTGSVIVLGRVENELKDRIEELNGAADEQSDLFNKLIGDQKLKAAADAEALKVEQEVARLRATLAEQQINNENRLIDLRRQSLSETERQSDIEFEAARRAVQAIDALAQASRTESAEEQAAAIATAKAAAERLDALSSQTTNQKEAIRLAEQAARIQENATKAEIKALKDGGTEREKQIKTVQAQIDALNLQKVTVPIAFDTTVLQQQIAELKRLLSQLAGGGVTVGSATGPATGPRQSSFGDNTPSGALANDLALRDRALQ